MELLICSRGAPRLFLFPRQEREKARTLEVRVLPHHFHDRPTRNEFQTSAAGSLLGYFVNAVIPALLAIVAVILGRAVVTSLITGEATHRPGVELFRFQQDRVCGDAVLPVLHRLIIHPDAAVGGGL